MSTPAIAAVDWGTSSFRLWLLDAGGKVLAERRSGEGMLTASEKGFAAILDAHLGAVAAPGGLPVVICGMAGARQGWIEAPYVAVPAKLDDIVAGAVTPPGATRAVRILPGLAQKRTDAPDVMRGEETQLAGIFPRLESGRHLVCMPGTHSKWVEVSGGAIAGFRTWMTGELFSVLSKHSILRHAVGEHPEPPSPTGKAFLTGCEQALQAGGDIGTGLFRLRAASLLQGTGHAEAAARLSGLLIGAEIASALAAFSRPAEGVILVASGGMAKLYQAALEHAGCAVRLADADEAVRAGLFAAALRLGLTGDHA